MLQLLMRNIQLLILLPMLLVACTKKDPAADLPQAIAFRLSKQITYNNIPVNVVIDKPALNELDVLIVFHGTVLYDSSIMSAANTALDSFKSILERKDMMIVSVAYPQEKLLLGDNIVQAEAALLWVQNNASQELGIQVKKTFLAGHSQGGYLVTRLNTMHLTNGVIANAPGPLNLVYRCELEEKGQIQAGAVCNRLRNAYGTTANNPGAYFQRSLLNFTGSFKSDILFIQGLADSPIQMYSWPTFKEEVLNCTNCRKIQFVEIPGAEHSALFTSPLAKSEFNAFINSR